MDIYEFLNQDNHFLPKDIPIENERIEIIMPVKQEVFSAMTTTPSVEDAQVAQYAPMPQESQNFSMPFIPKYITKLPNYSPEPILYQQNPDEE